ncbi:MAG: alpha/beta hydrolase family protein [Agathobaculum sp.]|uniref:alpha/beta hydrolase family protein n=1 Tax=Agathobaculum sp. TaxID=2048138 RepID=UPI003D94C29F
MDYEFVTTEQHYGKCSNAPDLRGLVIPGKRGKLLGLLYTAAGAGPHPVAVLLHGIPGNEKNLDIGQALRRAGFHVVLFHYSGSWGSDGSYAFGHNLEDANSVLDYILRDTSLGFDPSHIYAVGHSLGGFVCAQLAAHRPEIRAAALLMPCDIGRIWQNEREYPSAAQIQKEVLVSSQPWLSGTSPDRLLDELRRHSEDYRFENIAGLLAAKPLLLIKAAYDRFTPPVCHSDPLERAIHAAGGNLLSSCTLPTDHFAGDHRLALSALVTDFLGKQYRAAL